MKPRHFLIYKKLWIKNFVSRRFPTLSISEKEKRLTFTQNPCTQEDELRYTDEKNKGVIILTIDMLFGEFATQWMFTEYVRNLNYNSTSKEPDKSLN